MLYFYIHRVWCEKMYPLDTEPICLRQRVTFFCLRQRVTFFVWDRESLFFQTESHFYVVVWNMLRRCNFFSYATFCIFFQQFSRYLTHNDLYEVWLNIAGPFWSYAWNIETYIDILIYRFYRGQKSVHKFYSRQKSVHIFYRGQKSVHNFCKDKQVSINSIEDIFMCT